MTPKSELLFLVEDASEGGYIARAISPSIFTEADTLEELRRNIRQAVDCHFEPADCPKMIRLHIVHEEVLPVSGGYPEIFPATMWQKP